MALAAITVLVIWLALREIPYVLRTIESKNWPITDGIVTSATIKSEQRSGKFGKYVCDYPIISYLYTVGKTTHMGTLIDFNQHCFSTAEREKFHEKYQNGVKVNVSYDSGNPSLAILEHSEISTNRWTSIAFLLLTICGLIFSIWWEFTWRSRP